MPAVIRFEQLNMEDLLAAAYEISAKAAMPVMNFMMFGDWWCKNWKQYDES